MHIDPTPEEQARAEERTPSWASYVSPQQMASLPARFDWRDTGKVPPVGNQRNCGSCYVFATLGQLSSYVAVQNGGSAFTINVAMFLRRFKALQVDGCGGGNDVQMINSLCNACYGKSFVAATVGYETVSSTVPWDNVLWTQQRVYPFDSQGGNDRCAILGDTECNVLLRTRPDDLALTGLCDVPFPGQVRGGFSWPENTVPMTLTYPDHVTPAEKEMHLATWLLENTAMYVALNMPDELYLWYQFWKTEAYGLWDKNTLISQTYSTTTNHAVLLIGWTKRSDGKEVWIIQNSWGEEWGDKGVFYIPKGGKWGSYWDIWGTNGPSGLLRRAPTLFFNASAPSPSPSLALRR